MQQPPTTNNDQGGTPPAVPAQPPTQAPQAPQEDAKAFKMYKGKAPLIFQIIGGLMWLVGLVMIIEGIPMLLVFGLGIIPIAIGIFTIKYAKGIFKMQKKAYGGAVVVHIILSVLSLIAFVGQIYTGSSKLKSLLTLAQIAYGVFVILTLRKYKDKFVH